MPKVTVVIPVYNAEKYMRQCLDSVVNQTLSDIEIICVDDGSTDNSLQILQEYAGKDSRIKILTQQNQHAGVARNKGMQIANAKYIHFLDADDWIELNAYEKLYEILENTNVDMLKFRSFVYDNGSEKIIPAEYLDIAWIDKKYFNHVLNIIDNPKEVISLPDSPWSGIYKKEFLIKNNIYFDDFICANDAGFFYRCIMKAKKIYLSSEKLMYYRKNLKNSISSKKAENFECITKLYDVVNEGSSHLPTKTRNYIVQRDIGAIINWYNKCLNEYKISFKTRCYIKKCMKDLVNKILATEKDSDIRDYVLNFKKKQSFMYKLLNNIFSIKNVYHNDVKHKVITILGVKIKIKTKK